MIHLELTTQFIRQDVICQQIVLMSIKHIAYYVHLLQYINMVSLQVCIHFLYMILALLSPPVWGYHIYRLFRLSPVWVSIPPVWVSTHGSPVWSAVLQYGLALMKNRKNYTLKRFLNEFSI